MPKHRIPTPVQIRKVPVRVTTADGAFVATEPHSLSDRRSLLNTRAWIARRVFEITNPPTRKASR